MSGQEKHLAELVAVFRKQRKRLRKRLRAAKRQIERQGHYIKELKAELAARPEGEQ